MTTTASDDLEAWRLWRRGGIGASDVAAAHTGRYGGRYKVVADKLGIRVPGQEIDPAMADRGHRWEQPIADGVHAHTGLYVAGEQMQAEHPTQPRYRATLDGLLVPTLPATTDDAVAVLEVKTRSPYAPWPRDYWAAQVQWQLLVTGLDRGLLAIATIDDVFDEHSGALTEQITSLHYEWVYADPMLHSDLVELADELWGHVERGELPEPTDADALPYVKAANATADEEATADIDDLADLLARYESLKQAAKAAADETKTAEAVIRARMGEAVEAHTADGAWRVRCGMPVRKFTAQSEQDFIDLHGDEHPELLTTRLDRAKAKELMPEEYDALRFATPDRRLTIKQLEE